MTLLERLRERKRLLERWRLSERQERHGLSFEEWLASRLGHDAAINYGTDPSKWKDANA